MRISDSYDLGFKVIVNTFIHALAIAFVLAQQSTLPVLQGAYCSEESWDHVKTHGCSSAHLEGVINGMIMFGATFLSNSSKSSTNTATLASISRSIFLGMSRVLP